MQKRGFALIEVLVSVFILATVGLAIAGSFASAIKSVIYAKNVIAATALANEMMEKMHNLPYAELGTVGGNPAGLLEDTQTLEKAGITFEVKTTIEFFDDPYDGKATGTVPVDAAPNDYKIVTISIGLPGKPILATLRTNIAGKSIETDPGTGVMIVCVVDAPPPFRDITAASRPVSLATVDITNSHDATFHFTTFTNADNGCVMIPNLKPDKDNGYHVEVTKEGYSKDQTYPLSTYPKTNMPDLNIKEGEVERPVFVIDLLSTLNLKFQDVLGNPIGSTIIDINTISLLHFNGPDKSIVFTDETGKNWRVSAPGPEIDTGPSKFNQVLMKKSPDYIFTNDTAGFNTGTGNFTIEAWLRSPGQVGTIDIFNKYQNAQNFYRFSLTETGCSNGQSKLEFVAVVGGTTVGNYQTACQSINFSPEEYHHLALIRNKDGTNERVRCFIDGTSISWIPNGTVSLNRRSINNNGQARMSSSGGGTHYIDEFRFSNVDRSIVRNNIALFPISDIEYSYRYVNQTPPTFYLQGAKTIDNTTPIYKYTSGLLTALNDGTISLTGFEFDNYKFMNTNALHTICGGIRYYVSALSSGDPMQLNPQSTLNVIVTLTTSSNGPKVAQISPNTGQTNRTVNIKIFGKDFQNGITAKLYRLQSGRIDIPGTVTYVNTTEINVRFDLTTANTWNLELINPDNQKVVVFNGFEVKN